jgi:ABC-type transporter Mla MlaB component
MKDQALQYYMHDGPTAFRFELAGDLNQDGARRLDQDWRTASSTIGDRKLIVDITFVTNIDQQGRALLALWHRDGAQLIANSKASRALAESILGQAFFEPSADGRATATSDRTWLPFRTSFLRTRHDFGVAPGWARRPRD